LVRLAVSEQKVREACDVSNFPPGQISHLLHPRCGRNPVPAPNVLGLRHVEFGGIII